MGLAPAARGRHAGAMLYITQRSPTDRRALQRLTQRGPTSVAFHARLILSSATGLTVPAIAELFGCCRRTVRFWIHRFQAEELRCLLPYEHRDSAEPPANSAIAPVPAEPSGRLVPAISLTVPEVRRLLNILAPRVSHSVEFMLHWSHYRRYKQALAMLAHHRKRGAEPPVFDQVRL
jgi:Winged helix-turn helix